MASAHASRLIRETGQEILYLAGPGHGGPALVASGYLEGTYTETYPTVTTDADGMNRLFRQFSAPGAIPGHVSVTTPGSIHEGGELGYVLVHAFGAVLPILHLNGAKIAGPTVLGRNAASSTISSYRIGSDGRLSLLAAVAAPTTGGGSDAALSPDNKTLQVRLGNGDIASYAVARNGSLTRLQDTAGPPRAELRAWLPTDATGNQRAARLVTGVTPTPGRLLGWVRG